MSQDIDILNKLEETDLSGVPTAYPLLPTGAFPVKVQKIELEDQKPPRTGKNLVIAFALTEPAVSTEGQPLQPGYVITDRISLTQTEKYDPLPRLAQFREACLGDKSGKFMPLEQYVEQTMTIRTKHQVNSVGKDGTEYGPQTSVAGYVKKK